MLTPKTLKVRGFRGFMGQQEFDFDKPAVILFGANHCGKSSTLNAIEWCLFGDDCCGQQTTIRERVGWKIPNRHMRLPDVMAELVLNGLDGDYVVRRSQTKPGKRARAAAVELTMPGGEVLEGEEADRRLTQLLRCSFRDFMTTVYQHQEAIRGILIDQPKERNDAIDRLLGLSDYRNLLSGVSAAAPARWLKEMTEQFGTFEGRVSAVLGARETDLEVRRGEATAVGLPLNRLNSKAALASALEVQGALNSFAAEAGMEVTVLAVPEAWEGLHDFEESAKRETTRLRGEIPLAGEQRDLFSHQTALTSLITDFNGLKDRQKEITDCLSALGREHGGQETVNKRLAEAEKDLKAAKARHREINAQSALFQEAIDYIEKADPVAIAGKCPVCASEAPNLLQNLRSRLEQSLNAQIAAIKDTIKSLDERVRHLKKIAERFKDANLNHENLLEDLKNGRRAVGKLFGRELTDGDDPHALLHNEAKRVGDRLEEITKAILEKQGRLNEVEELLKKICTVLEILQLEKRGKIAQEIQESRAYTDLEATRDLAAEFVGDVEEVKAAVSAVSNDQARDKLAAAESAIDQYFRQLTKHPAVQQIKLQHKPDARTSRNSYEVTDQAGIDLTPILSQGDLNALALAIFLGLASASAKVDGFGFVMLDDPSQSLGQSHKEQLVNVLDQVARSKQVVIATMDGEFHSLLGTRLTRGKKEYIFQEWTIQNGVRAEPR